MKVTDVALQVVKPAEFVFQWKDEIPPVQITMTVVRLLTDEGVEGVATSWLPASPHDIADTIVEFAKPYLIGRDPLDREAIWHELMALSHYSISPKATSVIDIALWDLAAKAVGLPLYKLLGAYRDRIPAYASTVSYPNVEDYVGLALACQKQGFKAFKTHAYGVPKKDIEVCRAVREAVGTKMALMHDPVNAYDYQDALHVGRALEELDFHWYEAPIKDEDIDGYVALSRALDIPIAAGESNIRGIWDYARYLTTGAVDIVRCIGDGMGGITGLRKVGALCEAHNRRLEPHSYGSTLVQAAHLHYMLSVKNCEFFEMPVPGGILDYGMKNSISLDAEGMVIAPSRPGLGFEIDWDAIEAATVYRA